MPKMENSKQRTYSYDKETDQTILSEDFCEKCSEGNQYMAEATPSETPF